MAGREVACLCVEAPYALCGVWDACELTSGASAIPRRPKARLMTRPVTLLQASRYHRGATSPWVREVSGLSDRHLLEMNLGRR